MKSFQTVKKTVLTMVAMLFFALVVVGDMERVEADDTIEISIGIEKGSSPIYSKTSSQSVTRSGSWITLYQPNSYNFRIDYSANTTGSTRTGYVYVKEGSKTIKTYKITQSASVTVTYDKNGSGSSFTRLVTYGKTYGKVDKPTKTGYEFTGWYTAKTGGSQVTETTLMLTAANHTLYARWSPKKFTVYFNSNGGSSVSSKTVTYDGTYGSLTTPVKKNYTFLGWYTNSGTLVTASTKVTITSSQTLYAHWEGDKYTVTYDKNGGDGDNFVRTIAYGSTYTKVDKPTRTGYDFDGWYTAKTGGSQVTETTIMSTAEDHTVYAHWTAKQYTVTFNDNYNHSDTYIIVKKTVTYGSTYGELTSPTREYYKFDGWYTAATGGTKVTASTKVTNAADHTLFAHWISNKYTVTYDLNGGEGENFTRSISYNGTYGKVDDPKKTGYSFDGWYTAKSGGNQVTETTLMNTPANHTLYAHWKANSYVVTYDKNGGSGSNITRSIVFGSTYGKVDIPTRSGYSFSGWYTAKTGGSQVTETTLMTTATDHTLYARWTSTSIVIVSGGSSSCNHSSMVLVERVVGNCTRDGYEVQRCTRCGMTIKKTVRGTGHVLKYEVVVQPNCAKEGYGVTRCQICGTVTGTQTIARIPDHEFRITRVEPTVNTDGYEIVSCYRCGLISHRTVIPKLSSPDVIYTNLVRADEMGMSIFIYKKYIDQLNQEVNNWEGINDALDVTSTDEFPLLEQIRNALYFGAKDYRLRNVCQVLKSSMDQIDMNGLQYLEIRMPRSLARVTLYEEYTSDVMQNYNTEGWYNLSVFSATLPSAYKIELSNILKVTSKEKPEGTYFGNQGDYENDNKDPGAYDGLSFRSALKEIFREGVRNTILSKINDTLEYDEEMVELLTQYRADLLGGGLCGQTAAVNLYQYFATDDKKKITKEEFGTEMLEYFKMENGLVAWSEREATKGEGHGGEGWASICDYLNTKLNPLGLSASAGIEGIQGDTDKQFKLTKQMVQEGYPVLMSFFSETEDLRMQKLINNTISTDKNNTGNNHYVLVTGIYESAHGEVRYLKVASWGEEYYINWNEYATKANNGLFSDVGCGYVKIERLKPTVAVIL